MGSVLESLSLDNLLFLRATPPLTLRRHLTHALRHLRACLPLPRTTPAPCRLPWLQHRLPSYAPAACTAHCALQWTVRTARHAGFTGRALALHSRTARSQPLHCTRAPHHPTCPIPHPTLVQYRLGMPCLPSRHCQQGELGGIQTIASGHVLRLPTMGGRNWPNRRQVATTATTATLDDILTSFCRRILRAFCTRGTGYNS